MSLRNVSFESLSGYLDVAPGIKTIELVDELQHGPLHLVITTSPVIKPKHAHYSYSTLITRIYCTVTELEPVEPKLFEIWSRSRNYLFL